jgi:hypothetical protein
MLYVGEGYDKILLVNKGKMVWTDNPEDSGIEDWAHGKS